MDPAAHALMPGPAAAKADLDLGTWCRALVRFDGANLDGAVVELQLHDDGVFTGEVRIAGPPVP